ncbi:MAG: WYL domain-containing protein [Halothiobacillaceae bacterium]
MADTETPNLKWDVRQRLRLLEATVLLTGWVRTQSIMQVFGISRAQAAKDVALYQKLRPENLVYNSSRKFFEPSENFRPLLLQGRTSELLDVLGQFRDEESPVIALTAHAPDVTMLRPLERELDLSIFRAISAAATLGQRVSVNYQSMNRPEPVPLILSPHALVFSGFRWHVRAFSDSHEEYRDFVLARMRSPARLLEVPGVPADDDQAWHREVEVVITPHPDLPKAQRQVIADDYGMKKGQLQTSVREALLGYMLKLMQVEPGRTHPDPKVQQIVLKNAEELEPLLWKS